MRLPPPKSVGQAVYFLVIWAVIIGALYAFVAVTGIGAHRCSGYFYGCQRP